MTDSNLLLTAQFTHVFSEIVEKSDFQSHHHAFYELLHIINGSGVFLVDDTAYEFSGNTVLLIPPQQYHILKIPPQRRYDRRVIHFMPALLPPALQTSRPVIRQADENISALFEKIDSYADTFAGEPLAIVRHAVLTEIITNLCFSRAQQYVPQAEFPALVQAAVRYVGAHLDQPIDVPAVADALFVSPTHLSHLFAKTMNISLMRYVRLKKMYRAREYLKQGVSVTRTAELLGYESYPTFLRNYYAVFQTSPSQDKNG